MSDSIFGPWKELGNPCVGDGKDKTFGAQSTYIVKLKDKPDAYIAIFDIWRPKNAIDGKYLPLPIDFKDDGMKIEFQSTWDLSYFE